MTKRKWSQEVTEHSDALDLDDDLFRQDDPKAIALSLKRSAEHSHRRKGHAPAIGNGHADFLHQSGGG
jgi:hypothetical protein